MGSQIEGRRCRLYPLPFPDGLLQFGNGEQGGDAPAKSLRRCLLLSCLHRLAKDQAHLLLNAAAMPLGSKPQSILHRQIEVAHEQLSQGFACSAITIAVVV
jgi:hypothetical protein